tara:strand:+ start:298 stop:564 length:267 start_codon:yes stop_codon:yes gene_type:complete
MTMYKVCGLDDSYPKNITFENKYNDWTAAQDKAVQLLEDGVQWVQILIGDTDDWGLLQELNLERGIEPDPNFSTWTLAPYYVRLKNEG